jgi:hypothetical protein
MAIVAGSPAHNSGDNEKTSFSTSNEVVSLDAEGAAKLAGGFGRNDL